MTGWVQFEVTEQYGTSAVAVVEITVNCPPPPIVAPELLFNMTPGSTLNIDLKVRGLAKRSKLLVPKAPGLPFSEVSVGEHTSGISWQQGASRVWKVEARLLSDDRLKMS
jgi:hypothetical protein